METSELSSKALSTQQTLYHWWVESKKKPKGTNRITVRSAKKQERLQKNMERKTKVLLGSTLRRPLSFPPAPKWDRRDTLLCCRLGALPPPPLPHPPLPSQQRFRPGEAPLLRSGWLWVRRSRASCRVWRSLWPVEGLRVSEGRDQDALVIIMAPADTSAVPSFCALTPTEIQSPLVFRWNVLKFLRKWDEDRRGEGRLLRPPSKNLLLYRYRDINRSTTQICTEQPSNTSEYWAIEMVQEREGSVQMHISHVFF